MEEALEKLRTANAQGLTITTCVYPYSFWATYLSNNRFGPGWQQRNRAADDRRRYLRCIAARVKHYCGVAAGLPKEGLLSAGD